MQATRQVHDLVQGSDQWHQFRLDHFTASEAAAMLGISTYTTRNELLAAKALGNAKEFSDWVQENIMDYSHDVEAKARPIVEGMIDDELYPATWSFGKLSASCDGLTMAGDTAFEHKQWNTALAESVKNGKLPDEYQPQCQQIMMVTGAKRVIFVVSDGTEDNFEHMEVQPDPEWQKRIAAGWKQFKLDLESYQHVEDKPVPEGKAPEQLPALHIEVTGEVVASNLIEFRQQALAVFKNIKTDLQTDEDFADAEKTVKWCGGLEKRLKAAKEHALSQTVSIDELFRTINAVEEEAKNTRLTLEKQIKSQKTARRAEIIEARQQALRAHIISLNHRLGHDWMPEITGNFAGAIKGKRNIESLRNAADTELANKKIEANEIADRIEVNRNSLIDGDLDHIDLFPDFQYVCAKASDDFAALLTVRLNQQREKEEAERKQREADEARRQEQIEAAKAKKLETQQPHEQAPEELEAEPEIMAAEQETATPNVTRMTRVAAADDTVTVSQAEYDKLVRDSQWLTCLEQAGVDNWDGIDEARKLFKEFGYTEQARA